LAIPHPEGSTMRSRPTRLALATVATLAVAGLGAPALTSPAAAGPDGSKASGKHAKPTEVRFATFNASLNRTTEGALVADLSTPGNAQAAGAAETIQRADADVILVNEFDYAADGEAAELFRDNYLAVGQNGAAPVDYPYYYVAPSNTGVPSGFDLNNNGVVGEPGTQAGGDDSLGFGFFPGQYGMVVYSKHPIDTPNIRTFQGFRWADMPDNLLPADYYTDEQAERLRLSSKSHWDVPVRIGKKTVHVLASHPTPPSFDGDEDRNGRRNHDEIRFWADYVSGRAASSYIYDDEGGRGGLKPGSRFVVMGDQNSDPHDGDSWPGAIQQLLEHPQVQDPQPASAGGPEAAARQGGANLRHLSDPAYDTADFNDDPAPGNLRADYVLPSKNLRVLDAGVWWPAPREPGAELTGEYPFPTSDHRPVYIDIAIAIAVHR
jgi:hypothetical protein